MNISQHCFTYLGKYRPNGYYQSSGSWSSNSNYLSTYLKTTQDTDPFIGFPISGFIGGDFCNRFMVFNNDVNTKFRYWPAIGSGTATAYTGESNTAFAINYNPFKYAMSRDNTLFGFKEYCIPCLMWKVNSSEVPVLGVVSPNSLQELDEKLEESKKITEEIENLF